MESVNFAQLMEQTFQFVFEMFRHYGWWIFAIVGFTTLFMMPVNCLIKLAFKKTDNSSLQRLRKTLSSVCVYPVALGVLYLYQWLIGEHNYKFVEVITDVWYVGTLSMVLWFLIKIVLDVGIMPVVRKITSVPSFKKLLSSCGVDVKTATAVVNSVESLLPGKATAAGENTVDDYLKKNQAAVQQQISYLLNLYNIDKGKIKTYADNILNAVNVKHKINK